MASPQLSYREAVEQVQRFLAERLKSRKTPHSLPAETLALLQAAGRVLAQPIHADRDQPPFPRSTRDGFACRAAEAGSHQFLSLGGKTRAGQIPSGVLQPGEVWEIMTGAPVPEGADAVFMVEYAETSSGSNPGSSLIRLIPPRTLDAGDNIVPQAAEAGAGDLLIPPGVRIGPAQIALAAQCGYSHLVVVAQPRVAILSTGDELVPIESTPGPGQIRNSNSPMLAALVSAAGAIPILLPTVLDEEFAVDAALTQAIATGAELLLITGGISAGKFDLVEDALTRLGARFFFHGVAIQPGKPIGFGQIPRRGQPELPFFALPGNPISSAITFHLFAAPLLAALGEDASPGPRFSQAKLPGGWHGKPGLTRFLPAHCDFALEPEVSLISWQGSGDLAAFARANCCVVIPPEAQQLPEASTVQILLT